MKHKFSIMGLVSVVFWAISIGFFSECSMVFICCGGQ